MSALTTDIYNNDIGTDFFNAFEGNDKFRFAAEQRREFVVAGNDDFTDLSGAFVKFQIADFAQTFTVL